MRRAGRAEPLEGGEAITPAPTASARSIRVAMFPRSSQKVRSGLNHGKLRPPARGPGRHRGPGRQVVERARPTIASRGSARSGTHAMHEPVGCRRRQVLGRVHREVRRPSSTACCTSFTNTPWPPERGQEAWRTRRRPGSARRRARTPADARSPEPVRSVRALQIREDARPLGLEEGQRRAPCREAKRAAPSGQPALAGPARGRTGRELPRPAARLAESLTLSFSATVGRWSNLASTARVASSTCCHCSFGQVLRLRPHPVELLEPELFERPSELRDLWRRSPGPRVGPVALDLVADDRLRPARARPCAPASARSASPAEPRCRAARPRRGPPTEGSTLRGTLRSTITSGARRRPTRAGRAVATVSRSTTGSAAQTS